MNEFNTNPKITDNRVRYELDGLKRSDPKRGDLYIQILMEAQLFGEPEQPRILSNNARLDLIKFVRDLDPEGMEVVQSEVEERKKERLQSPAPRKPKALTPQQVQAIAREWDDYIKKGGKPPLGGFKDDTWDTEDS